MVSTPTVEITSVLAIPLGSAAMTGAVLFIFLKTFRWFRIEDNPARYGLTRLPLPYPGGIVAVVSFLLVSLFILKPFELQELGLVVSS